MIRFFTLVLSLLLLILLTLHCEGVGPFDHSLFHSTFKGITYTSEDGEVISKDSEDWHLYLDSPYINFFAPYKIVEFESGYSPPQSDSIIIAIPVSYTMMPAYPNPSENSFYFSYTLPQKASVLIFIIDSDMRLVAQLVNSEGYAGMYQVRWVLKNDRGKRVPSDIYRCIYRLGSYMGYGDVWLK